MTKKLLEKKLDKKRHNSGAVATANDALQKSEWEQFLLAAYLKLLDRHADPDGLKAYVGRLAQGAPKEIILKELQACPEGRRVAMRRRYWEQLLGDNI